MSLVSGIATNAAIYLLLAMSVIVVYRSSGVVNFGVGHLTMFCGLFYSWYSSGSGPWSGLVLTIVVGVALGTLCYVAALRLGEARGARPVALALMTLGFAYVLDAAGRSWFGSGSLSGAPHFNGRLSIAGGSISEQRVLIIVLAIGIAAFMVMLGRSNVGHAMTAVAHDVSLAALYGVSTTWVRLVAWSLSGMLAAIAGVLIASYSAVSSAAALPLTITALAAVIIGGISEFRGGAVGAVIAATVGGLFIWFVGSAFATVAVFMALVIVLAVRPQGLAVSRKGRTA